MNNLSGFIAAPDGRKSKDADQIIDAALETIDLLGRMFDFHLALDARRR